jgi:dCTP deaminase
MRLIQGEELQDLVSTSVTDTLDPGDTELDIRIGREIWTERKGHTNPPFNLSTPGRNYPLEIAPLLDEGYTLKPGHFMLATTQEYFRMPDDVQGILTLRSWAARSGLEQSSSLTLKPGWSGYLIMELRNNLQRHDLVLTPSVAIAQIQFFDLTE